MGFLNASISVEVANIHTSILCHTIINQQMSRTDVGRYFQFLRAVLSDTILAVAYIDILAIKFVNRLVLVIIPIHVRNQGTYSPLC